MIEGLRIFGRHFDVNTPIQQIAEETDSSPEIVLPEWTREMAWVPVLQDKIKAVYTSQDAFAKAEEEFNAALESYERGDFPPT